MRRVVLLVLMGSSGLLIACSKPQPPKVPSAEKIDLDAEGKVVGLF